MMRNFTSNATSSALTSTVCASSCHLQQRKRRERSLPLQFVSLLLVLLLCCVTNVHAGDWSHQGCFEDKADIQQRALPYVQDINPTMTVDSCLTLCAEHGMQYAGMEFKFECYCSKHPPLWSALPDSRCSIECGGGGGGSGSSRPCGGAAAISVYKQELPLESLPVAALQRPLVCLVMILKNEAHTILDTLNTIKDAIDCWHILDTGSTDGTQKIIRDFFANHISKVLKGPVPGSLFEEPFVDYGATRNRILVLAKEHTNPVFTLMLSADERLENPDHMREFLEDHRFSFGTMHGAYPVVMNTGLKFDSIRLARVDAGWRYKARVHEYLAPATGPYVALFRATVDISVLFNATDGERRFKSQWFIKKILEEDLERDPNDTRSIYYLARTNSGINNHTAAFYYYDLLAQRSKWDEEVYHGLTMKAIEARMIDTFSWKQRQEMLIDAFLYKPSSMDALHALAQDHFDSGRFHLAFLFIHRAVHLTPPPGLEVVENVLLRPTHYLYDYEGYRLMGFAAREIGEWEACVFAFRKVLAAQPSDDIVKNRITLCEEKLRAAGLALPTPPPALAQLTAIPHAEQAKDAPLKAAIPKPSAADENEAASIQQQQRTQQSSTRSIWHSLAYGFSFSFTLNVLGFFACLLGFGFFAGKKFLVAKKLKR